MWSEQESKDYNWASPGSTPKAGATGPVGHFTAVVWKGTQRVGCGIAKCSDAKNADGTPVAFPGNDIVTCRYKNAGNWAGYYPQNVKPDNATKTDAQCGLVNKPAKEAWFIPRPTYTPYCPYVKTIDHVRTLCMKIWRLGFTAAMSRYTCKDQNNVAVCSSYYFATAAWPPTSWPVTPAPTPAPAPPTPAPTTPPPTTVSTSSDTTRDAPAFRLLLLSLTVSLSSLLPLPLDS